MTAPQLLAYKPKFDSFLSLAPRPMSCYHFSSIFAWQDFFQFSFEIIQDRLCVFAHQPGGSFLYLPPLGGALTGAVVDECLRRMAGSKLARVENISENQLEGLGHDRYNAYLKAHEYVYRRNDLAALAGHDYKSRRHDIHVFLKKHPKAQFRPYHPQDERDCLDLYTRWAQDRRASHSDAVYVAMVEDNARVHARLLAHSHELDLKGWVVVDEGMVCAYSFGYALDADTFCVLLEIADLSKTGLAAYIFNEVCKAPDVALFEWINAMDDFGMPQVAQVKESYHPVRKLPVYTVRLKV